MAAAVAITRTGHTAADLRREAGRTRDANAARRMLALALILDGHSREQAAATCGMDRQTLRDWVHRFNSDGLNGLFDRPPPGRRPRLTPEQKAELAALVRQGPDQEAHGVVRWRRVDLKAVIGERFGVQLAERTIGTLLHQLGFTRLSPRPCHPKKDEQAQEEFKKTSRPWLLKPCLKPPRASPSKFGGRTKPESASKAP